MHKHKHNPKLYLVNYKAFSDAYRFTTEWKNSKSEKRN